MGLDFLPAYNVMLVLSLGPIIGAFTFSIIPMLMTAGRVWQTTAIRIFVMGIYFLSIIPLVQRWGVVGAAVASVISVFLTRSLMIYFGRDLLMEKVKSK